MPNHIQNRLKVVGKEVQNLLNHIKSKDDNDNEIRIDFNKIKPMPDSLNITSSSLGSMAQFLLFGTGKDGFLGIEEMQRLMRERNEKLRREAVDLALKYQKNMEEHGFPTWYEWRIENWGTKWNAYGQSDKRDTEDTIYFQTAWNAPIELMKELSSQFPKVELHLDYADEDSGSNAGKIKIKAGEIIEVYQPDNQSNEAYELFLELHPDCDYIKMIGGKYQYVEV